MLEITFASIRYRWRSLAGAAVAVFVSSVLVTALGVIFESGFRGGLAPDRYRAADLVVGGRQSVAVPGDVSEPLLERVRLNPSAAGAIAKIPGVAAAVADTTVVMVDPRGERVEAHGWSSAALTPYELVAGAAPPGAGEVVVDARSGARVGESVVLTRGGRVNRYRVVGEVRAASPRRADASATVFVADAEIGALAPGRGGIDAVGVILADGADRGDVGNAVRQILPAARVYTGRSRGDVERLDALAARTELIALSGSFGGVALLVALFVIAGTLSLSVAQREREYALLRAIGATPGGVRAMIAREVGLVAGLAAVAGVVPGLLLARWFGSAFVEAGVIPKGFALSYSALAPLGAVSLSMLTALGAGVLAARRPVRISPVAALRESAVAKGRLGRVRVAAGVACGVTGLAASLSPLFVGGTIGAIAAGGAGLLLIVAVGLLGPRVVARAVRFTAPAFFRGGAAPSVLAGAVARTQTRRWAAAIVPLALAISLGCIQMFIPTTTAAEADRQARDGLVADVTVASPGPGIDPSWRGTVAGVPGVTAVNAVSRSTAVLMRQLFGSEEDVIAETYALTGVDPAMLAATLDLGAEAGDLRRLAEPGTVALSTDAAGLMGAAVGRPITFHLGDGTPMTATVVATYRRGLGFGDVMIDGDVLRAHTTEGLADNLLVAAPGNPPAVARDIADAVARAGGRPADVQVRPAGELTAAGAAERRAEGWLNELIVIVLLGYVAIAVVNTLVMVTIDRRPEFALLHKIGATDQQIRQSTRREAVAITFIALFVGLLAAVPPLAGAAFAITGRPWPSIPLFAFTVLVSATALLGIASVAIPTRSVLKSVR